MCLFICLICVEILIVLFVFFHEQLKYLFFLLLVFAILFASGIILLRKFLGVQTAFFSQVHK